MLVRLNDGSGGRKAGDILSIKNKGFKWGKDEGLPNYAVVIVNADLKEMLQYCQRHKVLEWELDPQDPLSEFGIKTFPKRITRSGYRLHVALLDESKQLEILDNKIPTIEKTEFLNAYEEEFVGVINKIKKI